MNSIKKLIIAGITVLAVLFALYLSVHWGFERAYVAEDEALMITNKFGAALPADRIVVPPGEDYKGVQQELMGPGRYFLNPVTHDWKTVKLTQISAGDPAKWKFDPDGHIIDKSTA